ncbi:hypothetical protein V490_06018 [Pseudogymnoascus sp. VKM F-3557]|nr:hypothetical protein V490_06018 [Pseudogymnoascus sp. VKM F-3557]
MAFLRDLPKELVFEIVKYLDQHQDIRSIARICREFYKIFIDDVYRFNVNSRGGRGVLLAVANNQASAVGRFLDLGLDINAIPGCPHGSTLLHLAACYSSLATVQLLLKRGADINATNLHGVTPLFNAVKYRQEEVVRAMSKRITDASNVFVDLQRELTPLHAACMYKLPNAVRLFLELGVDLHAKDAYGRSPLHHALAGDRMSYHYASIEGDADFTTVSVLLEFGVKLDLVEWGYSQGTPVSTLELGLNHRDGRVRELFREKRDKTLMIEGSLCVGRAWMSSEAGENGVLCNQALGYWHHLEDYSAEFNCWFTRLLSESFISSCSGCEKPVLEPEPHRRREEVAELTCDSFPSLSKSVGPLPGPQSTSDIWSRSNLEHLVARPGPKPPLQIALQGDPFPRLGAEATLPNLALAARDNWASFSNPMRDPRVERVNVISTGPGEGARHKSRNKGWKSLEL